jgi:hypothetical protein
MAQTEIAARIRSTLKECGLPQAALAQYGLPYRSVSKKQVPGGDALIKLRAATGVNIDWLLTGEGEQFACKTKIKPRPMEIADIRELKARFTDFDQYFTMVVPGRVPQQIDRPMIAGFREQLKLWQTPALGAVGKRIREDAQPGFATLEINDLPDDEVAALFTRMINAAMKAYAGIESASASEAKAKVPA